MNGEVSFKGAYEVCWSHGADLGWLAQFWQPFIPPRRSILMVRVLRNRLSTDDNLRNCGMYLISRCSMCNSASESVNHLFLDCPFYQTFVSLVG